LTFSDKIDDWVHEFEPVLGQLKKECKKNIEYSVICKDNKKLDE
jgi:hypothetical protein